jgi:hypothetical protein
VVNKTIDRDNVTTAFDEGIMKVSPCAGNLAEASKRVNVPRLITAYYTEAPDLPQEPGNEAVESWRNEGNPN